MSVGFYGIPKVHPKKKQEFRMDYGGNKKMAVTTDQSDLSRILFNQYA